MKIIVFLMCYLFFPGLLFQMEKLLEESKLNVCPATKLHVINPTSIGIRDKLITIVPPSQSLENRLGYGGIDKY